MQIEWKLGTLSSPLSPYLSHDRVEWPGLHIHRAHVLPGLLLERASEFHEINIPLAGTLTTIKHNAVGRRVRTRGGVGSLCFTPAGQSIGAEWDEPLRNLGIFLEVDFISTIAAENGFSPDVEFVEVYQTQDPLIQTIGNSLIESGTASEPLGRLYSDSLIQTLALHLLSKYSATSPRPARSQGGLPGYRLRRVLEFIDGNLDTDISLADLAREAGLSQFHFSRAFRRSTGETPQQFVMHRRLERAKQLLERPDLPLVEVSLLSGFKSQSHFTSLFRKHTKLTPKLWRELKLA